MAARRTTPGGSVLIVALSLLLAIGVFLFVQGSTPVVHFCNMDGILVDDVPSGWDLRRDGANDCEWTLFNRWGTRAPHNMYEGISIDAPPPTGISKTDMAIAGVIAILASVTGMVAVRRHRSEVHVDDG